MGTRCLTHIKEGDTTLVTVYRQFDGYPDGHGLELAEFLNTRTLVNGLNPSKGTQLVNGAPDLAAQFVAVFKGAIADQRDGDIAGGIYIEPPGTEDVGEEFTYTVHVPSIQQINDGDTGVNVTVATFGDKPPAFYGGVEEFAAWCAS